MSEITVEKRNKVKEIIGDILDGCSTKRINNIERSIYNFSIKNKWDEKLYIRKARSTIYNLRKFENYREIYKQSSVDYNKEISKLPREICSTSFYNQFWKHPLDKYYLKYVKSFKNDIPDGLYSCRKCKSFKTKHVEIQTRSADEPMTCYVFCMNCDNSFKF